MSHLVSTLTIAAALGCGLVAGFFYSFSIVVMKALGRLPADQGIAAMQRINVVVLNAWFFVVFFGTAVICAGIGAWAATHLTSSRAVELLLGSIVYLAGVIVVTILFNVPLNNALARVDPTSVDGARLWLRYLSVWTRWNHARTGASSVAAALFIVALR